MNDTIINNRQKQMLELVNKSTGLSRLKIKEQLPADYQPSTPTIARDLRYLLKNKFLRVSGKGRNTQYFPLNTNPLLRFADIDVYFNKEPDQRTEAKKSFNFKVFSHLSGLFTQREIQEIKKINKSFFKGARKLNKDIYVKELERFIIELSWKSSEIEGNTYSLLDTETLLKHSMEAPGHPKEEAIMILNHKRTFETILANYRDFNKISFSEIAQLHNFLVKDLSVSTEIRHQAVGITGTTYRPLDNKWQVKEALEKLIKKLNTDKFPLEKALIAMAMISYIQPFTDGNKRTGRMLANAILLANDYFPLSYRSVKETEFKKALILFYETNSLFYLKNMMLEQYKFALDTYFK